MISKKKIEYLYNHLWVLYLLIPLIINPFKYKGVYSYNREIYYNYKEYYILFVTIIVLIFLIIKLVKGGFFFISSIHKLLIALLFVFTVGTFYASYQLSAFRSLLGFIFFYIIYLYGTTVKGQFHNIIKFLIFIGVIQVFIGILQHFDIYYNILPFYAFPGRTKIMGTIGYVNRYSHYISICFLITTFLFFFTKAKKTKLLLYVFSGLILYTIYLTQTRGSFLGILVVFLFLILKFRKLLRRKIKTIFQFTILIIFVTALFLMTEPSISERIDQSITVDNLNHIASGRGTIWKVTFEMIKDKPIFGHGTGSFNFEEIKKAKELNIDTVNRKVTDLKLEIDGNENNISYRSRPGHAHNEYLQLMVENGIPGLLILLLIIIQIYRSYSSCRIKVVSKNLLAITFLFLITVSFFSFPIHTVHNATICFLFLGIFDNLTYRRIHH